jgi:hypothetical protein
VSSMNWQRLWRLSRGSRKISTRTASRCIRSPVGTTPEAEDVIIAKSIAIPSRDDGGVNRNRAIDWGCFFHEPAA